MNKKEKLIEACEFLIQRGFKIVPYLSYVDPYAKKCCPLAAYAAYRILNKNSPSLDLDIDELKIVFSYLDVNEYFREENRERLDILSIFLECCCDEIGASLLGIDSFDFVEGFDEPSDTNKNSEDFFLGLELGKKYRV